MKTSATETTIACCMCGKVAPAKVGKGGEALLPMRWRRVAGRVYCPDCFAKAYVPRGLVFPVTGPVGIDWPELRKRLAEQWGLATECANWAAAQLFVADAAVRRGDKLHPMPKVYLYGLHNATEPQPFDGIRSQMRQNIFREVEAKYRKRRLEVVWRREAALPTYRYPFPLPVDVSDWSVDIDPGNGVPTMEFLLGESRVRVRLAGPKTHARGIGALRQLLAGEAVPGGASVYRVRAHPGDNRNGMEDREPGGGERTYWRVMVRLTLYLPRRERAAHDGGRLIVRTTPHSLLVARREGSDANEWWQHSRHLRAMFAAMRVRQVERAVVSGGFSDDRKAERRAGTVGGDVAAAHDRRCDKYRRRLATEVHQVTACLVGYARRRRVSEVVYDDGDRSFVRSFPYHELASKLEYKLAGEGIEFVPVAEFRRRMAAEKNRAKADEQMAAVEALLLDVAAEDAKRMEVGDGSGDE